MVTSKKVSIGARPTTLPDANAWVGERKMKDPVKRLTLDIPAPLHSRIKSDCAGRGKKMIEEITELLEQKWPAGS